MAMITQVRVHRWPARCSAECLSTKTKCCDKKEPSIRLCNQFGSVTPAHIFSLQSVLKPVLLLLNLEMLKPLAALVAFLAIAYYYLQHPRSSVVKSTNELNGTYDYIIVGGGTAGCVLAGRLSEDPTVSVLLLEAGGDEDDFWYSHIPRFAAFLQMTDFDWQYVIEPQKYCCNALKNKQPRWPRGKGLGGCSTHNYMNYVRCSPKDYDHWANDLKNPGWSHKEVLPYFKKLEKYEIDHLQGRTDHHGYDGPVTVNAGDRTAVGEAVEKGVRRLGYSFLDDTNGETYEGFSWVQFNIDKWGKRMSTAKAYLRPAMGRPNLHVMVKAHVSKIIVEPTKNGLVATGVELIFNNQEHSVKAKKEVIVSGGAINSPQILLLSGIGPRKQLEQFDIPVVLDNPAVGANLHNHIMAFLVFKTNASGLTDGHHMNTWPGYLKAMGKYYLFGQGPLNRTANDIMALLRTGLLPDARPDIQLYVCGGDPWVDEYIPLTVEATSRRLGSPEDILLAMGAVHQHPSNTGDIRLRSADPLEHPIIDYQYFKEQVDVDVLTRGLQMIMEIVQMPELRPFDVQYAESGPVPGCEQYKPLSNDYLKCSVRNRPIELFHPVGTCRMGPKGENSVVDHELRVHGVKGLRVVDASVFPDQLSGNTHIPTIMVAEKAADLIKKSK